MKKITWFVFMIVCLFSFSLKINAAGLSVSASAYTVYVGSSVNITASASGVAGQFTFKSNNLSVLSGGGEDWLENSSRTFTFKASQVGTASITVTPNNAAYSDGSGYYTESKTVTISVINKPVYNPPANNYKPTQVTPKSAVNYLSSLEIEGSTLNPVFNKETLDYTVELESGTSAINIKATAEHNKASIVGFGVKNVSEGNNNFEIVVTAENGSKRTYRVNAIVKEKDPIIVNIDNETYTVIRKREQLIQASAFYSESSVEINGEEIPAYHGEVTGYTLVGLKNSEGIINLYTYDKENNNYKLYQEVNFSKIIFYSIDADESLVPEGYTKDKVIINDIEVPCYKSKDNYILLYGLNIENNNKGFYTYDLLENTIQRYDDKIFDSYKEEIEILRSIVVGLLSIVIVVVLVSALQGSINSKNNNESKSIFKQKEKKEKLNSEKNKDRERKKEAKMLAKELKRKEQEEKKAKKKKKHKKDSLDDTNVIDITNINIKKK